MEKKEYFNGGHFGIRCISPLKTSNTSKGEKKQTYFSIPLCIRRALDGRDDKKSLRNVTIFPRFLATATVTEI